MFPLRAASFSDFSETALEQVTDWPLLPSSIVLDRVVGIAVNSEGFVYVAHRGTRPLLRLNSNGSLDSEIGAEHMKQTTAYDLRGPTPVPIATRYWLHGLHIDPWDNIWVTDAGRHLVFKFNSSGQLVRTFGVDGEPGSDDKHFNQPTHVCVCPSGDFFVTDGYGNSRIIKYSKEGKRIYAWGARGTAPGEFHTPHVITLGLDGLLYVADRENDRVQVFTTNGEIVAVWPNLHSIDGLQAGADGFIYASVGADNALLRLDRTGHVHDVWAKPGWFCYPHALAVTAGGTIYTAETGDMWIVSGRRPQDLVCRPRTGPEGSGVKKFILRT